VRRALAFGAADISSDQAEEPLLASISEVERELHRQLRSARRRAEFLAGRTAVRRAIASVLGECDLRALVIARHDDGAPRIEGIAAELAISISHSRTRAIAVAALGSEPIGIDLCDHGDAPRIKRVAERAFPRAPERALAMVDDRAARASWAIKEAVGKALRIGLLYDGGFDRIELLSLDPPRVRVAGDERVVTLSIREHVDAVEAVAIVER